MDTKAEALGNTLECFIETTLQVSVLLRLHVALDSLVFEIGRSATLSTEPEIVSPQVSNNTPIKESPLPVVGTLADLLRYHRGCQAPAEPIAFPSLCWFTQRKTTARAWTSPAWSWNTCFAASIPEKELADEQVS